MLTAIQKLMKINKIQQNVYTDKPRLKLLNANDPEFSLITTIAPTPNNLLVVSANHRAVF